MYAIDNEYLLKAGFYGEDKIIQKMITNLDMNVFDSTMWIKVFIKFSNTL